MREYRKATVKFNGGRGALLCHWCHRIVSTGFDHEDREHYCESCKKSKTYRETVEGATPPAAS